MNAGNTITNISQPASCSTRSIAHRTAPDGTTG
jgi:hypothetical protein